MTNTKPLKIVLLGDPGTGKTNLSSRYTSNYFNPKYEPTNGINFYSQVLLVGDQRVDMDLLDMVGDKKWLHLAYGLLRDADGILLVYDVSNTATFENLAAWLRHIRQAASPKTVIKLIANKNDLQSMVPRKKAEQFATDNGLSYIETSALNDDNIHLAFESIVQEIDVATHSLSEPPKALSGHDDVQEKPFQVVLIDIEQAGCDNIVCVEKPLEEANFIAISYRWGEVKEQVIDTKLGYMASITSFGLNDFYRLCRDMRKEADLQSIKYVWVDAICVDQNNQVQRKATIYQMSNIYHRAAYIVAVPDLHLEYLKTNGHFDKKHWKEAENFNEFMYYRLHEKLDQLEQITAKWYDEMGIPNGMARKQLTHSFAHFFADFLHVYNPADADSPCDCGCEHNCLRGKLRNCHHTPNAMLDYIQYAIDSCHHHQTTSDCALCLLQMDMCKHQMASENENSPESDQKWLTSVLREIRYDKYKSLVDERTEAVGNFMDYLEHLIEDWSSRVWVISECNIAKAKQSCKMKFWFLSLGVDWKHVQHLDFFVFDFRRTDRILEMTAKEDASDNVIRYTFHNYRRFHYTLMSQLNRRSFLEMMLNSKASRNEDRFYAIFPSTEYKNILTSREMVSSWQIDNIVSVKLKLYELMTTKDKLDLLYLTAKSSSTSASTFPAFANTNIDYWEESPVDYDHNQCNFDLNTNATLRLVSPDVSVDHENGNRFYRLNLSPKVYYAVHNCIGTIKEELDKVFNLNKKLWETLEINDVDDALVFVYIPQCTDKISFLHLDGDPYDDLRYITLYGSFKNNKWLLCHNIFRHFYIRRFPDMYFAWTRYDNRHGDTSFDIY